jgi:hypothetical protein
VCLPTAGISRLHDNTQLVVSYNPKKDRVKLDILMEDDRFYDDDNTDDIDIVDFDFLGHHKVEIDAVLAHVGAARLWEYIKDTLGKEFPSRDYNRVIDSMPETLKDHFPDIIKALNAFYERISEQITQEERDKIKEELQKVEGFIEVEPKRKEIDKRCGDIIEVNELLNYIATKIEELDRTERFGISDSSSRDDDDEK